MALSGINKVVRNWILKMPADIGVDVVLQASVVMRQHDVLSNHRDTNSMNIASQMAGSLVLFSCSPASSVV